MLNIGFTSALEAVLNSAGPTKPAEKRQVLAIVNRCLGISEACAPSASARPNVAVLTIRDAAECLAKKPRTIRQYVADGILEGVRTGRTGRLVGIPAREIDGYLARQVCPRQRQEAS